MTRPSDEGRCDICGEPMPEGESMFRMHGYSGPCPKLPLPQPKVDTIESLRAERDALAALLRECREDWIRLAYGASHEDVAAYRDFATRIDGALAEDKP